MIQGSDFLGLKHLPRCLEGLLPNLNWKRMQVESVAMRVACQLHSNQRIAHCNYPFDRRLSLLSLWIEKGCLVLGVWGSGSDGPALILHFLHCCNWKHIGWDCPCDECLQTVDGNSLATLVVHGKGYSKGRSLALDLDLASWMLGIQPILLPAIHQRMLS